MPNAHFVLPAPDYPTKIANLDEIKQIIENKSFRPRPPLPDARAVMTEISHTIQKKVGLRVLKFIMGA
jgi:hypothetical protein